MLDGKPVDIAPDGRFLIGFGRDAPAEAMLIATLADGRHITRVLTIAPHQWRIEQVDTPMRPPAIPDEDYQRIRAGELQQIEAARAIRPSSNGWRQPLMWPVTGRISGVFGSQRIYCWLDDARFFVADARALVSLDPGTGSGELDELAWFDWGAALNLDLPSITRAILHEVAARESEPERPIPFHSFTRGGHRLGTV